MTTRPNMAAGSREVSRGHALPPPRHSAGGLYARRAAALAWLSRAAGDVLTPAFGVRALFVAAVAASTVYLLGQPDSGELEAGERAASTVWSDRTVEVPDPVATELERIRAESAVMPVFVQDDMIPSRVMDGTRRVFRHGRRLVQADARELPGDFVADFYGVFHAGPAIEAAGAGLGPDDTVVGSAWAGAAPPAGARPPRRDGEGISAARTARTGKATPAPPQAAGAETGGTVLAGAGVPAASPGTGAAGGGSGTDASADAGTAGGSPAAPSPPGPEGGHPPSAGEADPSVPAERAAPADAGAPSLPGIPAGPEHAP
ncbi:MAG: hypothetical protein LBQ79_11920, partial [Deltaproteobacteria bacterium]|nr:hypothetical protein [Deltaproteobacteria bacterium]